MAIIPISTSPKHGGPKQEGSAPRVVFFGTPELAVSPLRSLIESGTCAVEGVVTQPDKPAGRGQQLQSSPVKRFATERGLPVFQPTSLRGLQHGNDGKMSFVPRTNSAGDVIAPSAETTRFVSWLNERSRFDLFIVVAYGKIIPEALIVAPKQGIVNIHYSVLPRWRGAAPIQRAVLAGDEQTGVSIMAIDEGLDTGPIYATDSIPILPEDTSGTVAEKLSVLGSKMIVDLLPQIARGELTAKPQRDHGVTYAEKLEREDFTIQWGEPALQIVRRVRASAPHPGARAVLEGQDIKIFAAEVVPPARLARHMIAPVQPGEVLVSHGTELIIAAGDGSGVRISEMQLPGRKRLPIGEILRGKPIATGTLFS